MKKNLSHILKLVIAHFGKFVKRIYVALFAFGIPFLIVCAASFLACSALKRVGMPNEVALTIGRILLTIAPVIPTCIYAVYEQEDLFESFNMDLCFIVWIATIVFAWWVW